MEAAFDMIANLFETLTYDEFDRPFDSIDDIARFILHPDNSAPLYSSLRHVIACQASAGSLLTWSATTIGVVRGMREVRLLMDTTPDPKMQIVIAAHILVRAVEILRGES